MDPTPIELLAKVYPVLAARNIDYCLAGGLAASLYRPKPRLTQDLDIAFIARPEDHSRSEAEEVIRALNLSPAVGFIDTSNLPGQPSLIMVTSMASGEGASLDLLLPTLPWVTRAVQRAQDNLIDFGFAHVPTITLEDLIVAKIFSLTADPQRFQDLDDLKSFCETEIALDRDYLNDSLTHYRLEIPQGLGNGLLEK